MIEEKEDLTPAIVNPQEPKERFGRLVRTQGKWTVELPTSQTTQNAETRTFTLTPEEQRDNLKRSLESYSQKMGRIQSLKEDLGGVEDSEIQEWLTRTNKSTIRDAAVSGSKGSETEEDRKKGERKMTQWNILSGDFLATNRLKKDIGLGLQTLLKRTHKNIGKLDEALPSEEQRMVGEALRQDWQFLLDQNLVQFFLLLVSRILKPNLLP